MDLEQAQALQKALAEYNCEAAVELLVLTRRTPRKNLYYRLNLIFAAAQTAGIDLARPTQEVADWLFTAALQTKAGERAASTNTQLSRLTLFSAMFETLRDHRLITTNPLRGMPRPSADLSQAPLPKAADLQHLIAQASSPLDLTLVLLYELAFRVEDLNALRWEDIDWGRGRLLRVSGDCALPPTVRLALETAVAASGGPMFAQGPVFDPAWRGEVLRAELWKLFLAHEVPYVSPSRVRYAGLRDFPDRFAQSGSAGFRNISGHQRAMKFVQQIKQASSASAAAQAEPSS